MTSDLLDRALERAERLEKLLLERQAILEAAWKAAPQGQITQAMHGAALTEIRFILEQVALESE